MCSRILNLVRQRRCLAKHSSTILRHRRGVVASRKKEGVLLPPNPWAPLAGCSRSSNRRRRQSQIIVSSVMWMLPNRNAVIKDEDAVATNLCCSSTDVLGCPSGYRLPCSFSIDNGSRPHESEGSPGPLSVDSRSFWCGFEGSIVYQVVLSFHCKAVLSFHYPHSGLLCFRSKGKACTVFQRVEGGPAEQ